MSPKLPVRGKISASISDQNCGRFPKYIPYPRDVTKKPALGPDILYQLNAL